MSAQLMSGVIDQAADVSGIKYIGFSGGEPFLHYDLLKEGLIHARAKGFATSVATNGFWGVWPDDVLIDRLKALPIDQLFLSSDYYHRQYVPDEHIGRAVSAARALNIGITVGIGETRSHSSGEYFSQMGDYKYLMAFYTYPFVRAGRASNMPEDEFFPPEESSNVRCRANSLLSVLFDGRVFPCCEQQVFATALELGNLKNASLKDIITSPDNSALMHCLLNNRSFERLIKESDIPLCAGGTCEACGKLFGDRKSLERLMPRIREIEDQAAVDQLLGR